ncbi:MAG TPA: Ig-like domain-containing protein [Terriglobales bacterium]|jgi:hypothetical protein|nr:Ig-like domain-containing protein [Terriglobales bacterium]
MRSHTLLCFLFIVLVCSVSASAIAVSVSSPANNSNITSPVNISASATPTSGFVITGWHIYVDSNLDSYSPGAVNAINTNLTIADGTHTVIVRAWDSSGAFASQTLSLTVTTSPQTVTITAPANNSNQNNSVLVTASAVSPSAIDHLEVWDATYGAKLGDSPGNTVNTAYNLAQNGSHTIVVQSISSGTFQILAKSQVIVTVNGTSSGCINSANVYCDFDNSSNVWSVDKRAAQGPGSTQPVVAGYNHPDNKSVKFYETDIGYSNVLFGQEAPQSSWNTSSEEDFWTLDESVNVFNPAGTQAFETDAQYVWKNAWTMFYTECDLTQGYWNVYGGDVNGGGTWQPLDGTTKDANSNIPPLLTCSRDGSDSMKNGLQAGWHHIVWKFQRSPEGFAIFHSFAFDDKAEVLLNNYAPTTFHRTVTCCDGDFGALIQLGGVSSKIFDNNSNISRDIGVNVTAQKVAHDNHF